MFYLVAMDIQHPERLPAGFFGNYFFFLAQFSCGPAFAIPGTVGNGIEFVFQKRVNEVK